MVEWQRELRFSFPINTQTPNSMLEESMGEGLE